MFSNLSLIYILMFVRILELPKAVVCINHTIELHMTGWEVRCKLQPNTWRCLTHNRDRKPRFYYDHTMEACKTYQYGGCSLSYNNFAMLTECNTLCHGVGNQKLSPQEMDRLSAEVFCRLQPEFGSCFGYQPMFYYDISTRSCKGFSYSGCGGNPNRFERQYACMNLCESVIPEYELAKPSI